MLLLVRDINSKLILTIAKLSAFLLPPFLVVETLEVGVSEEAAVYLCLQIFVSNKLNATSIYGGI